MALRGRYLKVLDAEIASRDLSAARHPGATGTAHSLTNRNVSEGLTGIGLDFPYSLARPLVGSSP